MQEFGAGRKGILSVRHFIKVLSAVICVYCSIEALLSFLLFLLVYMYINSKAAICNMCYGASFACIFEWWYWYWYWYWFVMNVDSPVVCA